jgi:nicotinamidase-related amidase
MAENIFALDPRQTILLVMDYQTAIIRRSGAPDSLLSRMADTIASARTQGIKVGYVWVAFDDSDYDAIPASNKMASHFAAERRLRRSDPDTSIHQAVAPRPGDIVVRKTRVGAFSTTDLEQQLRKLGIGTLILAGISTGGVVLSTVRDAADKDYRIFVVADCCFDADPQVQEVLTMKVFPRQCTVIDSTVFSQQAAGSRTGRK